MPATRDPNYIPPPPAPPPPTGSWQLDRHGVWQWSTTAPPDPHLVSQWGYGAVTDIRQDPIGQRNSGYWLPQHGGGWSWHWGPNTNLNQGLVNTYGYNSLTDPYHFPNTGNPSTDANRVPPPDVNAPVLTDSWHGVPPHITGTPNGGQGTQVSVPPVHSPYVVAPGDIRTAESVILGSLDTILADYATLKGKVDASKSQNFYMVGTQESLVNNQDRALLQVGDALQMTGEFVKVLNNAAQYYARADLDSYLPQS